MYKDKKMKYAIIAAGEGSRLAHEGMTVPKPLVMIDGEPMIDRLIRIFLAQGATEIDVICRERDVQTCHHLRQLQQNPDVPLRFIAKDTPSSMHSLHELSPVLQDSSFILTTVDTIFREYEFAQYVSEFRRVLASGEADGLMAVTGYIDDESPLYVKTDATLRIMSFLDSDPQPRYISGGIYGLTPRSLTTLRQCIARGESRMRNFQRALLADNLRLWAYPFTKILDIDHRADISKANRFLQ